jgi:Holliday junction resolvase RusA-like endonuclease
MHNYNALDYGQLVAIADAIIGGVTPPSPIRGIKPFVFTYIGLVVAKERARGGNFYTPKATRDFEAAIADASHRYMLANEWTAPFAFPLAADIEICVAMPENWPKWKRILAMNDMLLPSKQDADNKVKSIQDGMNKVVYKDDSQISKPSITHVYRQIDRLRVKLTPIGLTKAEVDRLEKIMKTRGA